MPRPHRGRHPLPGRQRHRRRAPGETLNPRPVTLDEVLASRERRAAAQREALEAHNRPVVSLGVVQPGPVKDGPGPRAVLRAALGALEVLFQERGWPCHSGGVRYLATGPEALLVVEAGAAELKAALVALEACHPLGRLWDLDVLDPQAGPITRRHLGLPPRTCLVCGEPAHACARSRAHSLDDLQRAIQERLHAAGLQLA